MSDIKYPSFNDREFDLLKKLTANTAVIAENGGGGGGGGNPGGSIGDWQYKASASTFGGVTPADGWNTLFTSPSSVNFAAWLTDATGSGPVVLANAPTITNASMVTPSLGVATATSLNGNFFTAGTYTLTGAAGKTLTFSKSLTLDGTDSTTMTFPATSASIARIDAAQTFAGVQTFSGSFIRTPATITITANAGPWDVTKGLSLATNNAATTLTPSAAGTQGQFALVNLINSHATIARGFTFDTATDFTITAAANRTTSVLCYSDGTGWLPYGGSPSLLDATADTAPDSSKLVGTWDATSGVLAKSTIAQLVSSALTATPATVAQGGTGRATLTANYVLLGNGTTAVQMIAPGTSGNILTSNGTTWSSTAPASGAGWQVGAFNISSISPADGATIYLGGTSANTVPTWALARIYIPKTGTINVATVTARGSAGTNETVTYSIRKNDTTDSSTWTATYDATNIASIASVTNLALAVTQGDYITLKILCPTWSTNPTAVFWNWSAWIE